MPVVVARELVEPGPVGEGGALARSGHSQGARWGLRVRKCSKT